MRRQTRQLILNLATGIAIAATAMVVFTPAAFAAPGTVTTTVNVRQGPSTNTPVVGTVVAGTTIDIGDCQGDFCFIDQFGGEDGYVSAQFIVRGEPAQSGTGGNAAGGGNQNGELGIIVGPDGVFIGGGTGGDGRRGDGRGRDRDDDFEDDEPGFAAEVCFYDRTRFRGESFCAEEGESIRRLGAWADRISSFENEDGLSVRVCRSNDFRSCRTYTTSAPTLGQYNDDISSIQIR